MSTSSTCSCCGARRSRSWRSWPSASRRATRLPRLLIYLLMGVALGEAGLGIGFEDAELAHALGFAALVVILAEGGLTTTWQDIRPSMRLGLSLATVGVARQRGDRRARRALPARAVVGAAVLLGAVTSPTDAAAVFSVLRVVPLPKRLTGALEAESGLNDAPTVVLVTLISTGALAEHGVLCNVGHRRLRARRRPGRRPGRRLRRRLGDAPGRAAVVRPLPAGRAGTLRSSAYGSAAAVHASGFAAVYVAALVLGNTELPHRAATRSFAEGARLAGPDRAVRDARPAALAGPDRPRRPSGSPSWPAWC